MKILNTNLAEAIENALVEVNNGLYAARQNGVIALMPEFVDIQVEVIHSANHLSRIETQVQNAAIDTDASTSALTSAQSGTSEMVQSGSESRTEIRAARVTNGSRTPANVTEETLVAKGNDTVNDIGGGQTQTVYGSTVAKVMDSVTLESGSTSQVSSGQDVTDDSNTAGESGTNKRVTRGTVEDFKGTTVTDNIGAQSETKSQLRSERNTWNPTMTTRSLGSVNRGRETTSYLYEPVS